MSETIQVSKASVILGALLIASLVAMGATISKNASLKKQMDHNQKALTDSIQIYKGRNGQLVAEKTILIGDYNSLKDEYDKLDEQVKDMKIRRPDHVVYVETEVINEVHDTTFIIDRSLPTLRKDFDFSNNFRQLAGFMELKEDNLGLNITQDRTIVDYTLAIKDGKVYMSSSNPYVQYNEIQGITLPAAKKPKFSVGIGPQIGAGFDLINKKPGIFAGVGISANFNLISF